MLRRDGQVVRPICYSRPMASSPESGEPDSTTRSLAPKPPPRWLKLILKVLMVLFSLAWLFWGGSVALHEKSEGWTLANAVAAVIVIVVAFAARTTWSGVLMLGCIALGFASCTANFHLNLR